MRAKFDVVTRGMEYSKVKQLKVLIVLTCRIGSRFVVLIGLLNRLVVDVC
jgi:hypothetical protein